MIRRLRGTLLEAELTQVVIDAGGVGYGVAVSPQTSAGLAGVGEPVDLLTGIRECVRHIESGSPAVTNSFRTSGMGRQRRRLPVVCARHRRSGRRRRSVVDNSLCQ